MHLSLVIPAIVLSILDPLCIHNAIQFRMEYNEASISSVDLWLQSTMESTIAFSMALARRFMAIHLLLSACVM